MPFATRKILFFICPICEDTHPLLEIPVQKSVVRCQKGSCNGEEVFDGSVVDQEPSYAGPLQLSPEDDITPPLPSGPTGPGSEAKRKQAPMVTVASAVLINVGLILTFVVLFYLMPLILGKCS